MSVSLTERLQRFQSQLEQQLLAEWQSFTNTATTLLEKVHQVTQVLMEENTALQNENLRTSSFVEENRMSYPALIRALQERITHLEAEEAALSQQVAALEKRTRAHHIPARFEDFSDKIRDFLDRAKKHTHRESTSHTFTSTPNY